MQIHDLQVKLFKSLQVFNKYNWLLDSYVLDFYVANHWSQLPATWRSCLDVVPPEALSELLQLGQHINSKYLWPLELLALKQVLHGLCISRKSEYICKLPKSAILTHAKLKYIFNKNVKTKKRHEIERMSFICLESCRKTQVNFVVDFGAGLAHLARVLGYAYGIRVCCLEMQTQLNAQARKIDIQLEELATKHLITSEVSHFQRPTHVDLRLSADMSAAEFLDILRQSLQLHNDKDFSFGIIGLHPCGDLSAILMRMFLNCSQAKFINIASCCYMKLSEFGYPLSDFVKIQRNATNLSWESREISCHATELYYDRLALSDYEHLKVHCFRAATERILVQHWPHLKRAGLKSVKHRKGMTFKDYFYKSVEDIQEAVQLKQEKLETATTLSDLSNWKRIVIFYTLRLMLAPLVETIILYDRVINLQENSCEVDIKAIFEPRISPRNHIISAIKTS